MFVATHLFLDILLIPLQVLDFRAIVWHDDELISLRQRRCSFIKSLCYLGFPLNEDISGER